MSRIPNSDINKWRTVEFANMRTELRMRFIMEPLRFLCASIASDIVLITQRC